MSHRPWRTTVLWIAVTVVAMPQTVVVASEVAWFGQAGDPPGIAFVLANHMEGRTVGTVEHVMDAFLDGAHLPALKRGAHFADRIGASGSATFSERASESLSIAFLALLERYRWGMDPATGVAIGSLDQAPSPVRSALAHFVDVFVMFHDAARDNVGPYDATLDGAPRGLSGARSQLVHATLNLMEVLAVTPHERLRVSVPPLFAVSLGDQDDVYLSDYVLLIDEGGNDTYHNNAGGNNVLGSCDVLSATYPAAALIDYAGDDEYGDSQAPRDCGVNGGGYKGAGFLFDAQGNDTFVAGSFGTNGGGALGFGFILDGGGDDSYDAVSSGVNGGGNAGAGFLIDASGSDSYYAQSGGTNGGGSDGSGMLVDLGGSDAFVAEDAGINGGAFSFVAPSRGFLLDAEGDDIYIAGGLGANGGTFGYGDSTGSLVDLGGDDFYLAEDGGTNGGSAGGPALLLNVGGNDTYIAGGFGANGGAWVGVGLLLDSGGTDVYQDNQGGSGTDKTVVPKGIAGAQVDLSAVAAAHAAEHPTDGSTHSGDVDFFNQLYYGGCSVTPSPWLVGLTLHGPVPGDRVAVAATGLFPLAPGNAAIASWEEPHVSFTVLAPASCPPFITVAGLTVEGELAYTLTYE